MHRDDAIRIVGTLTDAFPTAELDEGNTEALVGQLVLLQHADILDAAVDVIVKREDRFPSIARIRAAYRTVNEARQAATAAIERATDERPKSSVPEWVDVWWWRLNQTLAVRQAANTASRQPVEDRPPVRMRMFPQCAHLADPGEVVYTQAEYDQLEREWVLDDSPRVGGVADLVGTMVRQGKQEVESHAL